MKLSRLPLSLFFSLLVATAVHADSVIVFTEVMYHPPAATPAAEIAGKFFAR